MHIVITELYTEFYTELFSEYIGSNLIANAVCSQLDKDDKTVGFVLTV